MTLLRPNKAPVSCMGQSAPEDTAFETRGSGPAVVLIHGLGLNRHMWAPYVEALDPHYTVVTYDLLGHGDSVKQTAPYEMSQFVEQIENLRQHLGLDQVALAGFSFGGIINRAYALAHREHCAALVVLASYHDRTDAQREAVLARVEQARHAGPAATIDAALKRWFTEEFAAAHPEALQQVRTWVTANDPEVYPHLYHLMATCDADLVDVAKNIACPTLIVASEKDPGNTPEMAEAMGRVIPNARVEVVDRLRHMGLYEEPGTFLSLIEPFLAKNVSR